MVDSLLSPPAIKTLPLGISVAVWWERPVLKLPVALQVRSGVVQLCAVEPEERARLASAATINPAAHEAFLLGRYHFWKLTSSALFKSNRDTQSHMLISRLLGSTAAFLGTRLSRSLSPRQGRQRRELWNWTTARLRPTLL